MDSTTLTILSLAIGIIALGVTIYLTNRATQKILNKLIEISEKQHKDVMCVLNKVHAGNIANAKIQGCDVKSGLSEEEARKFGEIVYYDEETKLAWIRPKPTS